MRMQSRSVPASCAASHTQLQAVPWEELSTRTVRNRHRQAKELEVSEYALLRVLST